MNKQKTLIFSLSAMLFIALAFIVYSWTEPTSMPSSYNVPLNTSPEHQIKPARLYVEAIYDYDDDRYYVNPSYESAFSGKITIQDTTQESDSPNTVATKSYVDEHSFSRSNCYRSPATCLRSAYLGRMYSLKRNNC